MDFLLVVLWASATETAGFRYFSKIVLELHMKSDVAWEKNWQFRYIKMMIINNSAKLRIKSYNLLDLVSASHFPTKRYTSEPSWFEWQFWDMYFARLIAISCWPWARNSFASSSCHYLKYNTKVIVIFCV